MPEVAEVVGRHIRRLRNAQSLTLEDCAHRADLSLTFLGEIERGKKEPSLNTLLKLSRVLQVPLRELIAGLEGDWATGVSKYELVDRLALHLKERYTDEEAQAICRFVEAPRPA